MREENKKESVINKKWFSIVGFIVSIVLLLIAIVLSANEEKLARETRTNRNDISPSILEQASSELSKTVNEMQNETANNIESNEIYETNGNVVESVLKNETSKVAVSENGEQAKNETKQTSTEQNGDNTNEENKIVEQKVQEQFIKPVQGETITNYSMDSLIYSNTLQEWITHRGIDIKVDKTTVVQASAAGTVKYIKEDPRYGLSITIEHSDGFQTVYSSLLSSEFVKEGDVVAQGQSIGTVGNSAVFETADGSHLHFEILKDGEYVNPDIYVK